MFASANEIHAIPVKVALLFVPTNRIDAFEPTLVSETSPMIFPDGVVPSSFIPTRTLPPLIVIIDD
ncbi:MAG: hypothetical protein BWY47_00229 [Bacteroidetes bacterium ADurb.Bin302]|nr:MAG: hypothetical protein BWY47_00229 [Bacteroidetes bacterium ADurb.Bin302]